MTQNENQAGSGNHTQSTGNTPGETSGPAPRGYVQTVEKVTKGDTIVPVPPTTIVGR
jgi:hypothetical protein